MSKYKKRFYIIFIFFISLIPFMDSCRDVVYAANGLSEHIAMKHGGWAPNGIGDGGIYNNPFWESIMDGTADEYIESLAQTIIDNMTDSFIDGDFDNYVFNMFTCVIGTIAYSVGKALQAFGIGLSNIIYGRVLGNCAIDLSGLIIMEPTSGNYFPTTFFHFELVQGNIYGYIGAVMYAGFRAVAVVGIVCSLLTNLAVAIVKPTGDAREVFKSSLTNSCIMLAGLFLMPYFLDLVIYIRNVLLYAIGMFCFKEFGTYDLLDAFLLAYADTGQLNVWVLDLGMLGMVGITFYFMFQYMSTAMGTMLMFIFYPFVCIVSTYEKNAIKQWIREMLGYLLVPVIDACLFLVPVIIGHVAETQIILQVVSMGMIIPARQAVRSMLGMSSASGLDRVGAFGAMAAVSAAKTIAATVAKVVGTVASGGIASVASKAGGAMAGARKETLTTAEEQMNGMNGYGGSRVTRLPFDMDSEKRARNQPLVDEYNRLLSQDKTDDARNFRKNKLQEIEAFLAPKTSDKDREKDRLEGAAKVDALTGSDHLGIGENKREISRLMEENREYNASNSELKLKNAHIATAIENGLIDRVPGRQEIADNNVLIAENNQSLRSNMDKISALQEENRMFETSVKSYREKFGKEGITEEKRNEVEMRFANALNFDTGIFKSLTDAQKSEFFAQRALIERHKSLGMGIGAAGGAVAGVGGTMFMDQNTRLGAVTIGSSLGGSIGGYLGGVLNSNIHTPISNSISSVSNISNNVEMDTLSGQGEAVSTINQAINDTSLVLYNPQQVKSSLPGASAVMDAETASRIVDEFCSRLDVTKQKPSSLSDTQMKTLCSEISLATSVSVNDAMGVLTQYRSRDYDDCF